MGVCAFRDILFTTGPRTLLAVWWPVVLPLRAILWCGRGIAKGGQWVIGGDDPWSST